MAIGDLFSDEKTMCVILKGLASAVSIIPALLGVSYGLIHGSEGVCKAAEYGIDFTSVMMPMAFISAPSIMALILFFFIANRNIDTIELGIKVLVAGCLSGFGNSFGGYCIGKMASTSTVTKAQQKKFKTAFLVIMVFGEVIGLFSLITAFVFLSKSK